MTLADDDSRPPNVMYDNPASLARIDSAFSEFATLMDAADSPQQAQRTIESRLQEQVSELVAALVPFEASDVVEVVRREQMPVSLDDYVETEFLGLAAVIEVVAMLASPIKDVLAGSGQPILPPDVAEISKLAREIVDSALFLRRLWEIQADPHPLNRLSYRLAEQALLVRSMQHEHIRHSHFDSLFQDPRVSSNLKSRLGFDWADFEAVYYGSLELIAERANALLEDQDETDANDQSAHAAYFAFMFKPGKIVAIHPREVAAKLAVSPDLVSAVLNFVSFTAGSMSATEAVSQWVSGKSPMEGRSFLSIPGERYVLVHPAGALDGFRAQVEWELKKNKADWQLYEARRSAFAESRAMSVLELALAVPPERLNVKYRIPPERGASHMVNSQSSPTAFALAEADGIFVAENVAIVVEVKGGGLTPPARAGYADRLAGDLERTLGNAAYQARRARDLILENRGLWLEGGEWWDLSHVTMVHTIVVSLDDFGSAGIAMSDLVAAGVVPDGDFPWVVSLHDLEIAQELLERPSELLLYIRRRTSPEIARLFRTSDELDLLVLFLRGQLFALPSPELLTAQDPASKPASSKQRTAYRNQRPILVQSHTDQLDAWIYYEHGLATTPAEKPVMEADPRILQLVDWLAVDHKPGWFGFAPDLLDGGEETQRAIGDFIDGVVDRSMADGSSHSAAQGMNGQWGYTLLIAMTRGDQETFEDAVDNLSAYAQLKKHQTRAARALGMLIGPGVGGPGFEAVAFFPERWVANDDLDVLVDNSGLVPIKSRPVPPSAKRPTRKLRGKRR